MASGLNVNIAFEPNISEIANMEKIVNPTSSIEDRKKEIEAVSREYEKTNFAASFLLNPKHLANPMSFLFSITCKYEQVESSKIETTIDTMEKINNAIWIKPHISSTPKLKSDIGL